MRIVGHGVDVVEIVAVEQLRLRPHFDERCFTDPERRDAEAAASVTAFFAGRFAAKEAVLKALGTGLIDGLSWLDIEVRRSPSGAPAVVLNGGVAALAATQGVTELFVSISHSETVAIASAIAVAREES